MANLRFIADQNVGKLARMLRMLGCDTVFFGAEDDSRMIAIALAENRVILTRDTHIMERRLVIDGHLKAILIKSDKLEEQIKQVKDTVGSDCEFKPFTLCVECNQTLIVRTKEDVKDRVPPYVFQTKEHYMECPLCHRIYWRGTHWEAMTKRIEKAMKMPINKEETTKREE